MLRAAVATVLIGLAAAIALTTLHLVAGTPGSLARTYWPCVMIGAAIGGWLRPGAAGGSGRPWVAAGLAVTGLALLGARLNGVPAAELVSAAICLWAGVAVAVSGRRTVRG